MTRRSHARGRRTHVGLEQRFVAAVREANFDRGQRVTVAFSGGNDSLALALLIARTEPITHIRAQLVHVNHNLRESSTGEAHTAETLAAKLGLPFMSLSLEPGILERHPGVGIEEAARRERYLALRDAVKQYSSTMIATAHHQRDQAETVLLHLLHGSGITGLSGMSKLAALEVPWWSAVDYISRIHLWRPLLNEDPDELEKYVESNGLVPIQDPSNDELEFLRNAIRQKVLPVLEDIQPGATKTIARYAIAAWAEDQFLKHESEIAAKELIYSTFRIDRQKAKRSEPVFLRRILKHSLAEAGVENVTFERISEVASLVSGDAGDRVIQMENNCIAIADDGWLYFGPKGDVWHEFSEVNSLLIAPNCLFDDGSIRLEIGKTLELGELTLAVHESQAAEGASTVPIRRSAFEYETVLRVAKPGDRWAISGRPVNEWLRSQRVPAVARRRLMAVASPRGVWTIPSVAHPPEDDPCTDESQCTVFLEIRMQRSGDQG